MSFLDGILNELTSPIGDGKPGVVRRTAGEAVQRFKIDSELPITLHVGKDENGKLALIDTSRRGDSKLKKSLTKLGLEMTLPVGYVVGENEKGELTVSKTFSDEKPGIGEAIRSKLLNGGTGLFADLNSGLNAAGVSVEEVEARQAEWQKRKEVAGKVAGWMKDATVRGVSTGSNWGKRAVDVTRRYVEAKVSQSQAKKRSSARVIDSQTE